MPGEEGRSPLGDVGEQLARIEDSARNAYEAAAAARKEAEQAYAESRATNGRVEKLWEEVSTIKFDFYGPEEERRRGTSPGALQRLNTVEGSVAGLEKTYHDVKALASSRRWLIGASLTGITVLVMLIGVVVRATG